MPSPHKEPLAVVLLLLLGFVHFIGIGVIQYYLIEIAPCPNEVVPPRNTKCSRATPSLPPPLPPPLTTHSHTTHSLTHSHSARAHARTHRMHRLAQLYGLQYESDQYESAQDTTVSTFVQNLISDRNCTIDASGAFVTTACDECGSCAECELSYLEDWFRGVEEPDSTLLSNAVDDALAAANCQWDSRRKVWAVSPIAIHCHAPPPPTHPPTPFMLFTSSRTRCVWV